MTAPAPPPTGARADDHRRALRRAHRADGDRTDLVELACLLAEDGVPAEVILDDVRAGIAEAVRRRSRSGR